MNTVTRFDCQQVSSPKLPAVASTTECTSFTGMCFIDYDNQMYSSFYNSPAFFVKDEAGDNIPDVVLVAARSNADLQEIRVECATGISFEANNGSVDALLCFNDSTTVNFSSFPVKLVNSDDALLINYNDSYTAA